MTVIYKVPTVAGTLCGLCLSLSHTCRDRGERNLVFSVGLVLDPGAAVVGKRATSRLV